MKHTICQCIKRLYPEQKTPEVLDPLMDRAKTLGSSMMPTSYLSGSDIS